MASVARVRLPPENGGSSATSATNRTRTVSHSGSEGAMTLTSALFLPGEAEADGGAAGALAADPQELRALVAHLEALQAQQRSPQQPTPEVDALLARVLEGRPEWRARMAVLSRSTLLRQKILSAVPLGGRGVGSAQLGGTHPWRQGAAAAAAAAAGAGAAERLDPTISRGLGYTLPKAPRFEGITEGGEVDRAGMMRRSTPGPGAYSKSAPRGTAFMDGGERVVLGANHTCPWKKVLGRQINPVHVDATSLPSAPAFSFAGARRALSETAVGHGVQTGGPVKTDRGALSPGPVYARLTALQPGAAAGGRPRVRSRGPGRGGAGRVRCEAVPPEAPVLVQEEQ